MLNQPVNFFDYSTWEKTAFCHSAKTSENGNKMGSDVKLNVQLFDFSLF